MQTSSIRVVARTTKLLQERQGFLQGNSPVTPRFVGNKQNADFEVMKFKKVYEMNHIMES